MSYVKIKNIRIKGMNMIQGHGVLTPIPVFASVMFGHVVGARIQSNVTGVLSVFHDATPDVEYIKEDGKNWISSRLLNKRGACGFFVGEGKGSGDGGDYAAGAGGVSMSYQPHATASVTMSLVLELNDGYDMEVLKNVLRNMRFAGGTFEFDDVKDYESKEDIFLDSGYVVVDASDVTQKRLDAGDDIIQAVMQPLSSSSLPDVERGWHLPVNVGFAMLTDFKQRDGVRDNLNHAFAEPMIGLVKLMATRYFKKQTTVNVDGEDLVIKALSLPFWRHEWVKDGDISFFKISQ
jgi:hypothetical protein